MKKTILTALTMVFITVACNHTTIENNNSNTPDINGNWKVETIFNDSMPNTLNEACISFDTEKLTYSANTGVNSINGEYNIKEDTLTFAEGAMTQMMGDSISMIVEQKFVKVLQETKTISTHNNTLTLQDEKGNTLMTLRK